MNNSNADEQQDFPYLKNVVFDEDSSQIELDSIISFDIEKVNDVSLVLVHQKQNTSKIKNEDLIKQKYLIAIYGDISVKNRESTSKAKEVYIKCSFFLDEDNDDYCQFADTDLKKRLRKFVRWFYSFLLLFYNGKPLFDNYLKPTNVNSFCIYFSTTHKNKSKIGKVFKDELSRIDENMKKYKEFILEQLQKEKLFESTTITETLRDFKKIKNFEKYSLFNDIENISDILNYLVLSHSTERSEEEAFYNLLLKINDFYKKKFFFCCGMSNLNEINYSKSPYVFCFDCKKLICVNCFTFHRTHYYFDFCCIIKNKHRNIHSELSKVSNSSEKNEEHSNSNEKVCLDTNLNKLFHKEDYYQSNKENKFKEYSVFNAMHLLLEEHLTKLIPLIKYKFENEEEKFINMYLVNKEREGSKGKTNSSYEELIKNLSKKLKRKKINKNETCTIVSPFEDIMNFIFEPNDTEPLNDKENLFKRIDSEILLEKKTLKTNVQDESLYLKLVENTKENCVEKKYIDGFGSLFDFVMFYLERVFDEILNFGNQYYPINK